MKGLIAAVLCALAFVLGSVVEANAFYGFRRARVVVAPQAVVVRQPFLFRQRVIVAPQPFIFRQNFGGVQSFGYGGVQTFVSPGGCGSFFIR